MTDATRPNPRGLPLEPDPSLPSKGPSEAPGDERPEHPIDDPLLWPTDDPDAPDPALDLPGQPPTDPPAARHDRPDRRIT
jgi:hypothetical protein